MTDKYNWGGGTDSPDPITNTKLNQNMDYLEEQIADGGSIGAQFAQDTSTTAALVFGYKGGNVIAANVSTAINSGTVTCDDDSADNYVEVDASGVSINYDGFTLGKKPLFQLTTADGVITVVDDLRALISVDIGATSGTAPISVSGGVVSIVPASGTAAGSMSAANFTKLAGIATGATANQTNAYLLSRTNHTGTQLSSTISDFVAAAQNALENTVGAPVADVAALRAVAAVDRADRQTRFVEGAGDHGFTYAFNAEGTGVDDGDLIIIPTAGTGAWFKISIGGSLTKDDVGLGNVDNTADADKPVSTATQTALDLKAPLASPALTGVPTAPTAVVATNTTQIATTAFVKTALAGSRIYNETPTGTINGVNSIFTTASNYVSTTPALYLNGVRQTLDTDYSETGVNEITFITAPPVSTVLIIDYNVAA